MTIRDPELMEALRDEPQLLALADALQSAADRLEVPVPRRRARPHRASPHRARLTAVALAAVAALVLVLVSPWNSGGPSFVDRALAAVGNRPVLHLVVRYSVGERVDLRTGRSSPAHRDLELWYDAGRHVFRTVARLDGRVILQTSGTGNLGTEPFLLTSLYRKALNEKKVRKIGEAVLRGQRVIVIEAKEPHGGLMRASLNSHSFRLVRMQFFLNGRLGSQLDVLSFETVRRAQAHLPKPAPGTSSSSSGEGRSSGSAELGTVALAHARTVFGRPLLWPGRAIEGHKLHAVQLDKETDTSRGQTVHGRLLRLDYGAPSGLASASYLEIEEAPAASPLWSFESVYPPPPGYLDLTSGETSSSGSRTRTQWTGVMQKGGFYLRLTSWSRATLIAAAKTLRPVPRLT